MRGKSLVSKYLILSIIFLAIGIPTAYAITITLGGDPVIINGILDLMGNRITNVGIPTTSTDAATKAYVDSASGTDTLALLGCTTDQVARFDVSVWVCSKISLLFLNLAILDSNGGVGQYTSIAIGSDNFPIISYHEVTGGNLKLVHCTNIDCSSNNTPVTLDSTGTVGLYTSIAIGSDNFPVISYFDGPSGDLKLVHCTNTSCSANDTPIVLDSTDFVGQYTSIAIGADTFPVISYSDLTNDDLKLVHCTSIDCSSNDTPVTLDSTDTVGTHTSIAIGSDNFPVISYHDDTNSGLKLVHCLNTSCLGIEGVGFDTPVTLDSTDFVGFYTSIAIGSDNFPVISYFDATNEDLKLVHCTSIDCSSNDTPVTLDSSTDIVGQYTSITIGSDNFPVISYSEGTNGFLKLVHCTNTSCSANDTPITLDSTGGVGQYTSIAIGSGNFIVISYFDSSNTNLKSAACTIQGDCVSSSIIFE